MSAETGVTKIGTFNFIIALLCTLFATAVSLFIIYGHLKNYRRPDLQRLTIRILLMIPIYSIATITSLCSKTLSYTIDTVRDVYEAFVIYSFFILLENYLDGERNILKLLQSRIRIHHLVPFNYCFSPMDMSNPSTFLFLRRGIVQFVVIKPVLALGILILKIAGFYEEGYIAWTSAYLWTSLFYNLSICICMYCLVMFYQQTKKDLEPFRPIPKFVCVKAIVFLTFWQGLVIAFLVRMGIISSSHEYSKDNMALAIQDFLICIEMPFFAFLHGHAFPWTDYDDTRLSSRMPFPFAVRDVLGIKDILYDTYYTFLAKSSFLYQKRRQPIGLWDEDEDEETWLAQGRNTDENYESLEFGDEDLDADTEAAFDLARKLDFGDFNFPVLSEDPRFSHPPQIHSRIQQETNQFIDRVRNESQEFLSKVSSA